MTKTFATALLAVFVSAAQCACHAESLSSLTSKLNSLIAEKRKLQKQNPSVIFAEADNPSRNMQKTSDQVGGKYPTGAVKINREYYCPYCKATTANAQSGVQLSSDGTLVHASGCTKGKADEQKWRDMLKKVEVTADFDELIAEKEAEIEEVKRQIDNAKNTWRAQATDGDNSLSQDKKTSSGSGKLDSIFSMKFGTVIDVETAEKGEYDNTYRFFPKKKFRYFDTYSCTVVPGSSKVYAIRASISMEALSEVDIAEEQLKVLELLNKKYDVKAKQLSPTEWKMTFEDASGKPVRKIFVTPDSIVAIDVALRKEANARTGRTGKVEVGDDLDAL